ncbi:DNA polymerase III subunit alpha [Salisediminibacterium halotolerans]|uniref:DNA polymerase III subunit alpha n=1 Tax=Salisediminibacterium halotolerans TaxID=517425 RepID=A0A1H9V548_9BACI|nr:DNA polymerase III subunit alpha [Salisediminibacterium haloalkalitolerans]SES16970.1 DNA polymerase-3 subunit alpha [Salisediminibacterium haloalkalitolerans]
MAYVHLHVHSEYSLLQSTAAIPALVRNAAEKGFTALALTDKNAMYGTVQFYEQCLASGIKPILGVELTVVPAYAEKDREYTLILLAKSYKGYKNLLALTTAANFHDDDKKIEITYEELYPKLEEVIVLTPFMTGEIQQLAEDGDEENAEKLTGLLQKYAGSENVFIEIQNHWQKKERERMLAIHKWILSSGVPPVATNRVEMLEKNQTEAFQTLKAIRKGTSLHELSDAPEDSETYLKTADEMASLFPSWPQAVAETAAIAKECSVELPLGTKVLPSYPVPSSQTAEEYLRACCIKGVHQKYADPGADVWERLDHELSIISDMDYDDYFLIVHDFMRYAHNNRILTGPGRGSAAGSLVAFVLDITQVDPLKYDLLFERFLNPERVSMPDIDIDFSDRSRESVINYVAEKYGRDRVAQIVTFGTLAAKAALRDAARALGTDPRLTDEAAKQIPSRANIRLRDAVKEVPALQRQISQYSELQTLFRVAEEIEGLPRHTSVHAAGIVISEHPLSETVPLEKGHGELALTQYPMGDLEKLGLLKMDFLGLRNLSLIERIIELISEDRGESLSTADIPLDNSAMFHMFGRGDTNGIFQLESQGMKSVLKRLKPSSFEDIVAVNALYRPGPMEQIPVFINRKNGAESVSYPHPDLEPILKRTYGVMIYQEQIMQIASLMAGFSLAEADVLRRAVSKKKHDELERVRYNFIRGALSNGYSEDEAAKVYDLIERFADYGFNRSHAVAYSMISCQLGYLKAVYTVEFLTALMEQTMHHEEKLSDYIYEAKSRGIAVKPPSVNTSGAGFHVENGAVRVGLSVIKHLGAQTVRAVLRARKEEEFSSLFDLCARIPKRLLPKRSAEALIFAGALDEFGQDRSVLLASLDDALEYGERMNDGETSLFAVEDHQPSYTDAEEIPFIDRLTYEKETLGFYVSGHPLEEASALLASYKRETLNAIMSRPAEGKTVRAAGIIEDIRTIRTKKNQQMAFLHLVDESGDAEVTVFPRAYEQYSLKLKKGERLFIEAAMQHHDEAWKLVLHKAVAIDELLQKEKEKQQPVLYLNITAYCEKKGTLHEVKTWLQDTPGEIPVVLHYESAGKTVKLSEMWNIKAEERLLAKLEALLGKKNVFLRDARV